MRRGAGSRRKSRIQNLKHDAQALFHESREMMGKRPNVLITDGKPADGDTFNREFFTQHNPRSRHVSAIRITGHKSDTNNNKMERITGEICDKEKTMRGLKKKDTPLLHGMQVFHDFIKPHESLDGKTPA